MYLDNDGRYEFNINVSTGAYPTQKPDKPWQIQYATQKITLGDLERLQREGKSFCYNFKKRDVSGLITQHEKTLKGFDYTNIIFFDIDKMPIPMEEYIAPLPFKPSLAYTTISNGKGGKYGYRLLYLFDTPLSTIPDFDNLYYAIAAANGFKQQVDKDGNKFEFDYRKVNQQYYGGGVKSETIKTNIVYSPSDFSSYYNKGIALKETLYPSKKKNKSSISNKGSFPNEIIIGEATRRQAYYSQMENPFYNDLYTLSPKDFLTKYEKEYLSTYQASIKTALTLSSNGSYWIYPDNYQEIKRQWGVNKKGKRNVKKWEIGSNRRKRMYVSAHIMRHNVPSITKEQLIYNLIFERFHYYVNSDNKLNNNIILDIAEAALAHSFELSPCKHPAFSANKEYWLQSNMTSNQAKCIVGKVIREEQVLAIYDFGASVKENLKVLRENGIRVGKSYLYNLRKKYSNSNVDFPNEIIIGDKREEHAYNSQMENEEKTLSDIKVIKKELFDKCQDIALMELGEISDTTYREDKDRALSIIRLLFPDTDDKECRAKFERVKDICVNDWRSRHSWYPPL